MKRCARSFVVACLGSLVVAAAASAYTYPPHMQATRQLHGLPCSVTATFSVDTASSTMSYQGGVSCAGGIGQKTIDVVPQVFRIVNLHPLWFNIGGASIYQGPTPVNPLRLSGSRPAVADHLYRLLVYANVTLPDGRQSATTVCANCSGPAPTVSVSAGHIYAPQAPTTVNLPRVPCSVTEFGPSFSVVTGGDVMAYQGQVACTGKMGKISLQIAAQVGGSGPNDRSKHYTITGSSLSASTAGSSALGLNTARTVYTGHPYRVLVTAKVTNGTTTSSATVFSKTYAP